MPYLLKIWKYMKIPKFQFSQIKENFIYAYQNN